MGTKKNAEKKAKANKKADDPTIVKTQSYSFEVIEWSNGTATLRRENKGFNIYELIGLVQLLKDELYNMRNSNIKVQIDKPIRFHKDSKGTIIKEDKLKTK